MREKNLKPQKGTRKKNFLTRCQSNKSDLPSVLSLSKLFIIRFPGGKFLLAKVRFDAAHWRQKMKLCRINKFIRNS